MDGAVPQGAGAGGAGPQGPGAGGATTLRPGFVIALLGPTGVGKTGVAVALSRRLGVRVISCDSMQMYRGLPVLTNQPSIRETGLAPHELVGTLDPDAECTTIEYAALARPLIDEDMRTGGRALICGGTGLYMRAALAPLEAAPTSEPDARRHLEERAAREGASLLHAELARRDPDAATRIDPRNVRRVVRALEVAMSPGGSGWSGRDDLWKPRYFHRTFVFGLTMDRSALYRRIDRRAAEMLEGGAVEEVRDHRAQVASATCAAGRTVGSSEARGVRQAIGYRQICRYLDGLQSWEQTVVEVAGATRRYARRQETWLRKVSDAVMIDVQDRAAEEISEEILSLVGSVSDQEERSIP